MGAKALEISSFLLDEIWASEVQASLDRGIAQLDRDLEGCRFFNLDPSHPQAAQMLARAYSYIKGGL